MTDPTAENQDTRLAKIDGGPLTATAPAATISMKCTVQVGAANSAHNDADTCAVTSAPTLQVTAAAPTLCSYPEPDDFQMYLCTEATINGVTYYWDDGWSDIGAWTTSSTASCYALIRPIGPVISPLCVVTAVLRDRLGGQITDPTGTGAIFVGPDGDLFVAGFWLADCRPFDNPPPGPYFPDQYLCPVLTALAPGIPGVVDIDSEGDVTLLGELFWNCPPYES